MANNRLMLRCRACGEMYAIAKRFGGGYGTSIDRAGVYARNLEKWFDKHTWLECCNGKHSRNQRFELDVFDLVYEQTKR